MAISGNNYFIFVDKAKSDAGYEFAQKQLWIAARQTLRENMVGVCYDLIKATMPFPKGNKIGGGSVKAFEAGMNNFRLSASIAFKPIQGVQFGQLAVNDDIKSMQAYGFQFNNPHYQAMLNNGQWGALKAMFLLKGFTSDDELKSRVVDDATIELLHEWRMKGQYGFGKPSKPFFVRNVNTIKRLQNSANQTKIGFMAGGWLQVAQQLGTSPDKYTQEVKPIWMYNKGEGYVAIIKNGNEIFAANRYGNYGSWGKKCRETIRRRFEIMEMCWTEKMARWAKLHPSYQPKIP